MVANSATRATPGRRRTSRYRPSFIQAIHCRAVAVNADATGKTYPPFEYEVGKEKIREYAQRGR